jgi:hypothetical protein
VGLLANMNELIRRLRNPRCFDRKGEIRFQLTLNSFESRSKTILEDGNRFMPLCEVKEKAINVRDQEQNDTSQKWTMMTRTEKLPERKNPSQTVFVNSARTQIDGEHLANFEMRDVMKGFVASPSMKASVTCLASTFLVKRQIVGIPKAGLLAVHIHLEYFDLSFMPQHNGCSKQQMPCDLFFRGSITTRSRCDGCQEAYR